MMMRRNDTWLVHRFTASSNLGNKKEAHLSIPISLLRPNASQEDERVTFKMSPEIQKYKRPSEHNQSDPKPSGPTRHATNPQENIENQQLFPSKRKSTSNRRPTVP